jgi:hypothetical protein
MRAAITRHRDLPVLNAGFESSVPGLHFVGAAAVGSFGPLLRFIAGAGFAARSVTRAAARTASRKAFDSHHDAFAGQVPLAAEHERT